MGANGKIKPAGFAVVSAVFAIAAYAPVQAVAAQVAGPRCEKIDADRDGFLSREDAGRVRGYAAVFAESDDDRDGRLNEAEFVKAQAIRDRVRNKAFLDDSVITAKIKALFVKDREVTALKVNVKTDQGIVLLSGFVRNEQQARRAQEIAASVEGVQSVKSNLVVKSEPA